MIAPGSKQNIYSHPGVGQEEYSFLLFYIKLFIENFSYLWSNCGFALLSESTIKFGCTSVPQFGQFIGKLLFSTADLTSSSKHLLCITQLQLRKKFASSTDILNDFRL